MIAKRALRFENIFRSSAALLLFFAGCSLIDTSDLASATRDAGLEAPDGRQDAADSAASDSTRIDFDAGTLDRDGDAQDARDGAPLDADSSALDASADSGVDAGCDAGVSPCACGGRDAHDLCEDFDESDALPSAWGKNFSTPGTLSIAAPGESPPHELDIASNGHLPSAYVTLTPRGTGIRCTVSVKIPEAPNVEAALGGINLFTPAAGTWVHTGVSASAAGLGLDHTGGKARVFAAVPSGWFTIQFGVIYGGPDAGTYFGSVDNGPRATDIDSTLASPTGQQVQLGFYQWDEVPDAGGFLQFDNLVCDRIP